MQAMCPVREKKCSEKRIKPKAWFSSFRNLKVSCEKKHLFIILLLRLLDKIKGLRNGYNIKTSFFSQDITTVSLPPHPQMGDNNQGHKRERVLEEGTIMVCLLKKLQFTTTEI